jgi:prophage antirepressor-like protein
MDLPAYNVQDTELGSAFEMIRSFAHDGTQFQVRIAGTKQEPLFNASDIGTVLGYTKIRDVVANLPDNMKSSVTADAIGTLGGPDRLYITEPGLYRLVMRSNKPVALQFQDWVFNVLKRLRLDGEVKLKEQIAAKDTEMKQLHQVIQEKDMELKAGRVPFSNRQPLQSVYVFTNDTYEKINLYKIGETHSGKSIKRIKQQQSASAENLRLIFEVKTINSKILETAVHSVLSQLNCHANGEWFQAPIGKIRGIIRGLNNTLNIALTVENATEEEIVEQLMNYKEKANQVVQTDNVNNVNQVDVERFIKDTYVKTDERVGIKSDAVVDHYIIWAQHNGVATKIPTGFKRDLDLAFKGRELDKNTRRFTTDNGQQTGWGGWKQRAL